MPTVEEARSGGPTSDQAGRCISPTITPSDVDVAVEQFGASPAAEPFRPHLASQSAKSPLSEASSSEALKQLEKLARDFNSLDDSPGRREGIQKATDFSAGLRSTEPSIGPAGSTHDELSDRNSIGKRLLTLASFFMAAVLVGVAATLAWQSHRDEAAKMIKTWAPSLVIPTRSGPLASSNEALPYNASQNAAPPQSAPAPQTAQALAASATTPEIVQQLAAMARNFADVRRSLKELAAEQEILAAAQKQLAAEQKQMAQKIVRLEATKQGTRATHAPSHRPVLPVVPLPPRKNVARGTSTKSAARSSVPRSAPNPLLPPAPVPLSNH